MSQTDMMSYEASDKERPPMRAPKLLIVCRPCEIVRIVLFMKLFWTASNDNGQQYTVINSSKTGARSAQ